MHGLAWQLKDEGDADEIRSQLKRLVRAFGWLIEKEKAKKDTLVRRVMERMNALSALVSSATATGLLWLSPGPLADHRLTPHS